MNAELSTIILKVFRPRGRASYRIKCATAEEADATEARYKADGWLVTRTVREPKHEPTAREKRQREAQRAKRRQVAERVKEARRAKRREAMEALAAKLKADGRMDPARALKAARKLATGYMQAEITTSSMRASSEQAVCRISVGDIKSLVSGLEFNMIRHWCEAQTFEAALEQLREQVKPAQLPRAQEDA